MITTTAAGRTWHYSHNLGRQTAEHNQSKFGRTGGYCYPMDVAYAGNDILFVISRGWGNPKFAIRDYDAYLRISKTTIDEDHIGDFARGGFTWPVGNRGLEDRRQRLRLRRVRMHHIGLRSRRTHAFPYA